MSPTGRILRVRKRDGREVPYDRRKIESAVARAESAAGDPQPGFPAEVTDVVERLLERRFTDPDLATPGIEAIQDLVERALVEMGAAAVAKAYILYREKRAQIRTALLVRDSREEVRGSSASPRVEARDKVEAWNKGKVVAALMGEADLPRESAEEVAARVESRVLASGSRSISTALVRELVDNELVELGLEGALRRQRPIGIPRHDLRRALFDPGSSVPAGSSIGAARARIEEVVAGEVLSRFAMEDLLPPYVADLVRAGDLEFEDLSLPHLPLTLAVPLESLLSTRPSAAAAATVLPEIGRLARAVSRTLVLEGAEPLLTELARAGGSALEAWLGGIGAAACAAGREIEIAVGGSRATLHEPLVEALSKLEREVSRGSLPRIVLDSALEVGGTARAAAVRLLKAGLLVPGWSAEGESYAGPGIARKSFERGVRSLGAVAVPNLPRLARRAGAWREDALLESVAALVDAAIDGLSALDDFRRECADTSLPRTRASSGFAIAGLRETLAILGDGEHREEHASRLVACLVETLERRGRARELDLSVTPCFGERAAARFARLDAAQFRLRQPWLFAEPGAPSLGERLDRAYGAGFDLEDRRALLAAVGAMPTGALHPPSALEVLAGVPLPEPGSADARLLEAFEALARERQRARGAAHALYALPSVFGSGPKPPTEDLFDPASEPEPERQPARADP